MELNFVKTDKPFINDAEVPFAKAPIVELAELELVLIGGGIGNCELG